MVWLLVLPKKNVCWLIAIVSKKKNGNSDSGQVALNALSAATRSRKL